MEADATHTSGPASPPDPPQDRTAETLPTNIAFVLHVLLIVLGYGRHLIDTLDRRAAAPTFPIIAAAFGTARLAAIKAHLDRGLLRAAALERMLRARAASGRDLIIGPRRRDKAPPAAAALQAEPPPAEQPAAPRRKPRQSQPSGSGGPELFTPTREDLDRQVRRRSIGRTLAEICLDLGVVPILCSSAFWNELFDIMYYSTGHGIETLMAEKHRREQAFIQEQDRTIGSSWDWINLTRDEIRQILGFFIGEEPVDPFAQPATPGTAAATGPP